MKSNKENVKLGEERDKTRSSYSELPEAEEASPSKVVKKDTLKKKKENREIRILRRNKTLKERNDPNRFSGDGINFKAKIIGTERVLDARGNRMCQGALQRLKAAVKTSGDHKQKIILNISLNGIMIKDEKSGELLHHHPIHKISFISQDTNDNRAFGYVFGSPQTGHEFFGIKTEKIASQVVLTLRDLFLTALELKKKELEEHREEAAQSQPESKELPSHSEAVSNGVPENGMEKPNSSILYSNIISLPDENSGENGKENVCCSEPVVDTLLDLQFTMDSLEQGISQMDHSIASAASQALSFSEDDISESSGSSLPTPFQFKLDKLSSLYQETLSLSSRSSSTSDHNLCPSENKVDDSEPTKRNLSISVSSDQSIETTSLDNGFPLSNIGSTSNNSASSQIVEDKYAVFLDIDALPSIFDNPQIVQASSLNEKKDDFDSVPQTSKYEEPVFNEFKTSTPIVFAELDPLGDHPFVDKKDFFQELKNPPKKILKDLVTGADLFPSTVESDDFASTAVHVDNSQALTQVPFNPFVDNSLVAPNLPPRTVTPSSGIPNDSSSTTEEILPDVKNPFNPFISEDYRDVPPPSSPPPPPPPRLPTMSPPPPPRPPSRSAPTQPLPKRKSPFATAAQSWFSFDQDAVSRSVPEPEFDGFAPPLPSPARKFPADPALRKIASTSNSPASPRRIANCSPVGELCKVLSRHESLMQEVEAPIGIKDSPPLPPKPGTLLRPPPSLSGSSGSAVESSSGGHSSSSLVFSSSDDGRVGSSSEALFTSSTENSDVFAAHNGSSIELSPDSIFRRKSDPFADEFFLSLPKKLAQESSCHTNGVDK
ncbi:Protein disabled [Araneus ventricosus]|uniref:Protein disabled n=1 Tax=Araneus ventricosus TaxID=182803 RepID=A0A4Y2D756_ARAVE|nr:Protein disabled [Araneus ventricosus]